MKSQEITKLHRETKEELNTRLLALQKQMVEMRMQKAVRKEKNTKKMMLVRKDIARIKTVLREIELSNTPKTK